MKYSLRLVMADVVCSPLTLCVPTCDYFLEPLIEDFLFVCSWSTVVSSGGSVTIGVNGSNNTYT